MHEMQNYCNQWPWHLSVWLLRGFVINDPGTCQSVCYVGSLCKLGWMNWDAACSQAWRLYTWWPNKQCVRHESQFHSWLRCSFRQITYYIGCCFPLTLTLLEHFKCKKQTSGIKVPKKIQRERQMQLLQLVVCRKKRRKLRRRRTLLQILIVHYFSRNHIFNCQTCMQQLIKKLCTR